LATPDGDDAPRLIDELVPRLAAMVDDVIPKRNESNSLRFAQARAALEHFQDLMRQHLRALVLAR
jgi:hypothetical protein